jgi:hypothetical protein
MLIVLYILTLIGSIYVTFAYYQKEQTSILVYQTGEVEVTMLVSFDGVFIDQLSPYYDATHQELIIHASDITQAHALSKLKITVVIRSDYASRVRIKLKESYIRTRTYLATEETFEEVIVITQSNEDYHPYSQLKKGDMLDLNVYQDGYQYVRNILKSNHRLELPLIDGGSMLYARTNQHFKEDIILRLGIMIEVVQANRYQDIWKVDSGVFGL